MSLLSKYFLTYSIVFVFTLIHVQCKDNSSPDHVYRNHPFYPTDILSDVIPNIPILNLLFQANERTQRPSGRRNDDTIWTHRGNNNQQNFAGLLGIIQNPIIGVQKLASELFYPFIPKDRRNRDDDNGHPHYDYDSEKNDPQDVVDNLSLAAITSQMIYKTLDIIETIAEIPVDLFSRTVNELSNLSQKKSDFAMLGILGIDTAIKRVLSTLNYSYPDDDHKRTRNEADSSYSSFPLPALEKRKMNILHEEADHLTGDIETLVTVMSKGSINPIEQNLKLVHAATVLLSKDPSNAESWSKLVRALQNMSDSLRRMRYNWKLTDSQQNALNNAIDATSAMLEEVATHRSPVEAPFVENLSSHLNNVLSMLLPLNGTYLRPLTQLNGHDIEGIISRSQLDALDQLIRIPINLAENMFRIPFEILKQATPFELVNIPNMDVSILEPEMIIGSLRDVIGSITNINHIVDTVDELLKKSSNIVTDQVTGLLRGGQDLISTVINALTIGRTRQTSSLLGKNLINLLVSQHPPHTSYHADHVEINSKHKHDVNNEKDEDELYGLQVENKKKPNDNAEHIHRQQHAKDSRENTNRVRDLEDEQSEDDQPLNVPFEKQLENIANQLPIIKKDVLLYEQLRESECQSINRDFNALTQHEQEQIKEEIDIVCDVANRVPLTQTLSEFVSEFENGMQQQQKLQPLMEKLKDSFQMFIHALETEEKSTERRNILMRKLELPVPPSA